MNIIPSDKKKIKARIREYERKMQKQKELIGGIDDGAGNRYLLGPLYMLLDDIEGALKSFEWFDREFPDDSGDLLQYVCWAIVLKRARQNAAASEKLLATVMQNVYIIPFILGRKIEREDMWHASNIEDVDYLGYIPDEIMKALTEADKKWIANEYDKERTQIVRAKYVALHRDLDDLPVGPERSRAVEQVFRMKDLDFEGIL